MKPALFLAAACVMLSCNFGKSKYKENPPNIVIILADDLGYADVGFHGSDINTPHLDTLALEGARLENFYCAPMCSPTRAGLMTGRYPIRYGMMRSVIPAHRDFGLDPKEQTLPEMLGRAGYEHRACIGKWHLGHLRQKWLPNNQGFTHFVGCYNGQIDYFTRDRNGETDWHRNAETDFTTGYVTDIIADESINFINSVPADEPYFLYVPFTAPHAPYQAKEEDIAKYPNRSGNQQVYAAMADCMDQNIGRILEAIDKRGDRDQTLILFFSDNGGVRRVGNNYPMKGSKLTVNEGGIRVVALAHWPDGGIAGGRIIEDRMGYIDIFPTLKAITHHKANLDQLDGINVLESMKGDSQSTDRKWYSYVDQKKSRRELLAVNYHDWKLVVNRNAPDAFSERVDSVALFRLGAGHVERNDVKMENMSVFNELQKDLYDFLQLRSKHQIPRYHEFREGFTPPKDWIIK